MAQRSPPKIRSPETWRQVREAWEAGESGSSCARRFDVGLANLWRRRDAEGWTRPEPETVAPLEPAPAPTPRGEAAADARPEIEIGPREAVERAMTQAAILMAAGRGTEAGSLLRAAESLGRMTGVDPGVGPGGETGRGRRPAPSDMTGGEMIRRGAAALDKHIEMTEQMRASADATARAMLGDPDLAPLWHIPFVYHWRAANLGPEVAARDRATARDNPAADFWDVDGRLRPLDELDLARVDTYRHVWRGLWGLPQDDAAWDRAVAEAEG